MGKKIITALESGTCLKPDTSFKNHRFAQPDLDPNGCIQITHIAAQTLFPISNSLEMRGDFGKALNRVGYWKKITKKILDSSLKNEIIAAFPSIGNERDINIGHIARALAEFIVLEFQATQSPLDKYLANRDNSALTLPEKMGAAVFLSNKARCTRCHSGPLLSDQNLHAVAIPQFGPGLHYGDDWGAYNKKTDENLYAFRTPSLRNLSSTGPYMHNGAFKDVTSVIEYYNNIFKGLMSFSPPKHPAAQLNLVKNRKKNVDRLDVLDNQVREPLMLSSEQIRHLNEFLMKSLNSPLN